jgi:hypothetical protein
VLARVAPVCVRDVGTMGPTIIHVVVAFAIWWALGPCWWVLAWVLVGIGRLVGSPCWQALIWVVAGRETGGRQGRLIHGGGVGGGAGW